MRKQKAVWEIQFDDKFTIGAFTWNGDNATGLRFALDTRRRVKKFIRDLLTENRDSI